MGMISIVNMVCAHCERDNAVLEVASEIFQPLKNTIALTAICRSCSGCVIVEVEPGNDIIHAGQGSYFNFVRQYSTDINIDGRKHYCNAWGVVQNFYPTAYANEAPDDTPPRVAKFFVEAQDNFKRKNFETCGTLCRKVIDLATKHIADSEDISAWKLHKRIEQLKNKGSITKEMFDWADLVRLDGNEQTHSDDEFDEHSAKAVLDFTETFLLYAFTLPAMVATKRAESENTEE